MRAYWFDNVPGDQRAPHDSGKPVDPSYLSSLGILHYNFPSPSSVDALASSRGYKNRDEITVSKSGLGEAYDTKVRSFFAEHLHEDEEIRYILDGQGYFDVRGKGDEWVRILLEKNDLMIMPAGIYHRFTTDLGDYVKAMRLFRDEPKWTPLNRGEGTEGNEYRVEYLRQRDGVTS